MFPLPPPIPLPLPLPPEPKELHSRGEERVLSRDRGLTRGGFVFLSVGAFDDAADKDDDEEEEGGEEDE